MKETKCISQILFLFVFTVFCQGCFVVGICNDSTWRTNNPTRISENDSIQVKIDINKRSISIPIPFLILTFDKKGYGITIYVNTENNNFDKLDSVSYEIQDSSGVLISSGVFKETSISHRKMKFGDSTMYYQSWAQSPFTIAIPRTKKRENLKLSYRLHIQDKSIDGISILNIDRKLFWISFFYG